MNSVARQIRDHCAERLGFSALELACVCSSNMRGKWARKRSMLWREMMKPHRIGRRIVVLSYPEVAEATCSGRTSPLYAIQRESKREGRS